MTAASYVARRVCGAALTVGGALLGAGVVAGGGAGYVCSTYQASEGAAVEYSVRELCPLLWQFGGASAATAMAVAITLALLRRWANTGSVAIPSVAAALIPAGSLFAALPVLLFLSQHMRDMANWLGGLFLMVPLFQLFAILTLSLGGLGVAALGYANDERFARTFTALAVAHLGILVCSFTASQVTALLDAAAGAEVALARQHHEAVLSSTRNLALLLVVYVIGMPMVVMTTRRSNDGGDDDVATADTFRPSVPQSPVAVAEPRKPLEPSVFSASSYAINATYLAWPFGGRLRIVDLDTEARFTATVVPMQLRKTVHVSRDDSSASRVLTVEARQAMPLGAYHDITDSVSRQRVGVVSRHVPNTWRLYTAQDEPIGEMTRRDFTLGSATYDVALGTEVVANLIWTSTPRPRVILDFGPDAGQIFDHRIGIALALLLFVSGSFASR